MEHSKQNAFCILFRCVFSFVSFRSFFRFTVSHFSIFLQMNFDRDHTFFSFLFALDKLMTVRLFDFFSLSNSRHTLLEIDYFVLDQNEKHINAQLKIGVTHFYTCIEFWEFRWFGLAKILNFMELSLCFTRLMHT